MPPVSNKDIDHVIYMMINRVETTAKTQLSGFPHYSDEYGRWVCTIDGDWTGGFWVGLLWLSYVATGEEKFLSWAKEWMRKLRGRVHSETVFRCFLFYYGAALGDILVHDNEARQIAIAGARGLASLYNKNAKLIPLGRAAEEASSVGLNQTNVDGVMSIALLSYAAEKTKDNTLAEIGVNHALTHIHYCVLDDGSVIQSATFDPSNGTLLKRYTHKGYGDDTVWARAQAWAMLGYSLGALWVPREKKLLETAIKVSDWWIKHVPDDFIAFWDFNDPSIPNTFRDTSATAIAAASLLKLSKCVNETNMKLKYEQHASITIQGLIKYITPVNESDKRPPGMLTQACYNKRINLATSNELIWGDYFLLESLLTLKNRIKHTI